MSGLSILFGVLVGFALGLTGGGGSILAVPLLVYGLGVPAHSAVAISLAAVGVIALLGAVERWWRGEVAWLVGLIFAGGGVAGAPLGTWLGQGLSEAVLLGLFAALMLAVAMRMWLKTGASGVADASEAAQEVPGCGRRANPTADHRDGEDRGDGDSRTPPNWRCVGITVAAGLATGVLSGLFGVGGGFVIVPALVLVAAMPIHRAVATSLLVIAVISVAGVTSQVLAGRSIDPAMSALFVLGGIGGLWAGGRLAQRLSPHMLQRIFAGVIAAVAVAILVQIFV